MLSTKVSTGEQPLHRPLPLLINWLAHSRNCRCDGDRLFCIIKTRHCYIFWNVNTVRLQCFQCAGCHRIIAGDNDIRQFDIEFQKSGNGFSPGCVCVKSPAGPTLGQEAIHTLPEHHNRLESVRQPRAGAVDHG